MTKYFLFLAFAFLTACSDDAEGQQQEGDSDSNTITQSEYDALSRVCEDDDNMITLTPVLQDETNYLTNEYTVQIYSIVNLSEQFRTTVGQSIFPTLNAERAEVDNIGVDEGDIAYEWNLPEGTYRYIQRDLGYQIYFLPEGSLFGREVINLDQNEDCSRVFYYQYAIEDEGEIAQGDLVFEYTYQQAGTAQISSFGSFESSGNENYRVRVFEDTSGEIRIKDAGSGDIIRKINWQADGSGSYEEWENGSMTDSGTWVL